ncbi:MAG: hypothetical protein FWC13_12555 [Oscillospiraceae bacterium]|nr:hypothetical protein [Oscillospiraceae bacterium]
MDKQLIIDAFRNSIQENEALKKAIFGCSKIPENIEETELAISSLDFVDLLIDVENRLGLEIADDCLTAAKTKIADLVAIITLKYSNTLPS